MDKQTYIITTGETGNDQGHQRTGRYVNDAAAIRAAKRDCKAYDGNGWWRVDQDGNKIAAGGKAAM